MSEVTLGQNIRKYRKKLKLTQEELGIKIGVHPNSIRRWEKGERYPTFAYIEALANALEISANDLTKEDEMCTETKTVSSSELEVAELIRKQLLSDGDNYTAQDILDDIHNVTEMNSTKSKVNETLGLLIMNYRINKCMSTKQLADYLAIIEQKVIEFESGKRPVDFGTLIILCQLFGEKFSNSIAKMIIGNGNKNKTNNDSKTSKMNAF